MNRVIYKYPLHQHRGELTLRDGAYPLTVQVDQKTTTPCMWAVIDLDEEECKRKFWIVGTGYSPPEYPVQYVGTFQNGQYVWHVFLEIQ